VEEEKEGELENNRMMLRKRLNLDYIMEEEDKVESETDIYSSAIFDFRRQSPLKERDHLLMSRRILEDSFDSTQLEAFR
jgi:hypothetical protein